MDADLASTIAGARKAAGLTQAALARRTGISPSYLSRIEGAGWEVGGPWPSDAVLRALARVLALSSTELIAGRRALQRDAACHARAHPADAVGRTPYAVSMGSADVDAAARGVVEHNPPAGTLRSAQVITGRAEVSPSYLDALASALAADPDALLYRVCAADRRALPVAQATVDRLGGRGGNVRTRVAFCNPLAFDVLIGDHEVFLGIPDRRGHPHLRAGIVVDDPDFVAAVRSWFDESVWDAPSGYADLWAGAGPVGDSFAAIDECLSGAEKDLDPAAAGSVGPGADAYALEGAGQDVPPMAR